MKYISTRGKTAPATFGDAVMMGLAPDGGLLLPDDIPFIANRIDELRKLPYQRLAYEIIRLYADIPDSELRKMVKLSYSTFTHKEVTPVVNVGDVWFLELFHGPTLAFKDVALQFLGNLFEYKLSRTGRELNILAATSGDTGSAAICGVRGRKHIRIFVMHPHGRVSSIQERQMTSVLDANVFNIAVDGTFDDCQGILKDVFNDLSFKDRYALGAVNSINWARVLAQIVYYFYAAFRVMDKTGRMRVRFAVPTGNFGDIFAGYIAARMGLPVSKLVLATNENDILSRFFNTGVYSAGKVHATISPSMDIQVASNFERYLFYKLGSDPVKLAAAMDDFKRSGRFAISPGASGAVDPLFAADSATTDSTLSTIRRYYVKHKYLMDPHTAVGAGVARMWLDDSEPMICLATAHPAKFPQAIIDAIGKDAAHHPEMQKLEKMPTRMEVLPASVEAVRSYIERQINK
ncbi:MAG: threonine synthase [Verrucomicrobia bacterium]|nr:threonine synthase [Verrucomicrobiota bacterium]